MEKMMFEQFADEVVNKVREFLPESFARATVELQSVVKNNDLKLTGILIRNAETNVCPTIYLEAFYDEYKSGEDMGHILSEIADFRMRNEVKDRFDVDQVTDFERVRGKLVPRLVRKKWNREFLEERPHRIVADLAVTYHIFLSQEASVPVTDAMIERWGVDADALYDIALNNMPRLLPSTFEPMSAVIGGLIEDLEEGFPAEMAPLDDFMYILTNEQKLHGAAALLDEQMMKSVLDRFGEGFYILPSSVHEVIIIKADETTDVNTLTMMVQEVNETQVAPADRLSDHAYRYSAEEGLVSA